MKQRICLFVVLLFISAISANAQGTPGVLRCNLRGGLEIHTSRDPGSSVIGRIQCGDPVLIIDQRFGSPHIRTEDGKDGYIISQNFGQWSLEPESSTTTVAAPAVAVTVQPPINRTIPNPPQRPELQPEDEFFRRFDIAWVVLSYNRQGTVNLYGGDLSFGTNITDRVGIVADVAIHQTVNSSLNSTISAYRFGPRFYAPPIGRVALFGEILAGGMRFTGKESDTFVGTPVTFTTQVSFNGFSMAAGGGMDVRIKPWFAWRAFQADYSLLHFLGGNSNGVRAGTGIVFRFGH